MHRVQIWAIYYASIVSFKMHPRNSKTVDLEACAKIADQMLDKTYGRFGGVGPWVGQQPPPSADQ